MTQAKKVRLDPCHLVKVVKGNKVHKGPVIIMPLFNFFSKHPKIRKTAEKKILIEESLQMTIQG